MSQYGGGGKTTGGGMAGAGTSNSAASTSGGGWGNAGGSSNYGKGSKASTKASRAAASKASQAKAAAAKAASKAKAAKAAKAQKAADAARMKSEESYGVFDAISHKVEQGWNSFTDAMSPMTDSLGLTSADRSVHSSKDGGSREAISGTSYALAQKGMYAGLRSQKALGSLSPSSAKVLGGYDAGRYGAFAADALGSQVGPLGFIGSKVARQGIHNANTSTLGMADGFAFGGMSADGAAAGSTIGSFGGPIGAMLGGYIGGYLGNDANAQALGLTSNSPSSIGGYNPSSNGLGTISASHPALTSNTGGNGGGNGGSQNNATTQPTAIEDETAETAPFDWGQWSHLYTPETVRKALTAKLPTSRKMASLPRSYYV